MSKEYLFHRLKYPERGNYVTNSELFHWFMADAVIPWIPSTKFSGFFFISPLLASLSIFCEERVNASHIIYIHIGYAPHTKHSNLAPHQLTSTTLKVFALIILDWMEIICSLPAPTQERFVELIWMMRIHLRRGVEESLNYCLLPKLYVKLWLCPSVSLICMHRFPQSHLLYLSPWKNGCHPGCVPGHQENSRCIGGSCILKVSFPLLYFLVAVHAIQVVTATSKEAKSQFSCELSRALQIVHKALKTEVSSMDWKCYSLTPYGFWKSH